MDTRPVGVFDSGVGGISTLGALIRELPEERFLYYGDTANAPYGTKEPEEVLRCVRAVVDRLLAMDVKALVIACNTATSVAAAALRAELALPIVAMEPALKPAHTMRHGGTVLVLATPVTLRLAKFQRLMELYGEGAEPVPCPGLMELVEREAWTEAEAYLRELLARYRDTQLDAVVLGCTHYSFLKPVLRGLLPAQTAVLDGNAGTARQLRRVLTERGLLAPEGSVREVGLLSSSPDPAQPALMRRLLETAGSLT